MVVLGLGGLGLWLGQRSRRRRRHTAALENAVVERTADLRREIEERSAAEARAATLREGLRQANRLATLGQIAASVAHETAQPVAAIRTYAATSRQFLDMGEPDEVNRNLKAIDRLAERIGTVTAELRGFARKGGLAPGPVPLIEIIEGARLLLKERLSRVDFAQPVLPPGLMVLGDHVRLEQVLVNLLQNALEALDKEAAPHLDLAVQMDGEEVRVIVSDNGPASRPRWPTACSRPLPPAARPGWGWGW
jgi:two-component system C4-dicarboxylate transport sensor histidine kinase DctB